MLQYFYVPIFAAGLVVVALVIVILFSDALL